MKPPTTPKEWWSLLDSAWPDILQTFLICERRMEIRLLETTRFEKGTATEESVTLSRAALEKARSERNHLVMAHVLQQLWEWAPDSAEIRRWPAWGTICDLCSESWVFD